MTWLIRNGKLKAKKTKTKLNRWGYMYDVEITEVNRYKRERQPVGYPRGRSRK